MKKMMTRNDNELLILSQVVNFHAQKILFWLAIYTCRSSQPHAVFKVDNGLTA